MSEREQERAEDEVRCVGDLESLGGLPREVFHGFLDTG